LILLRTIGCDWLVGSWERLCATEGGDQVFSGRILGWRNEDLTIKI
jgi:hypothetical protein